MAETNYYLSARSYKSKRQYDSAREHYLKAIQTGDSKGYYGLTVLAEEMGADADALTSKYAECFEPIKKSALDGDPIAASIIGVYYAMGLGETKQDPESAHLWFLVGALGGDEVAQFNLAVHYYLGVAVHPNTPLALHWLEAAINKGYEPAIHLIAEIKANTSKPNN